MCTYQVRGHQTATKSVVPQYTKETSEERQYSKQHYMVDFCLFNVREVVEITVANAESAIKTRHTLCFVTCGGHAEL